MKKSQILLGVLALLAALVLVSCSGLTSTSHETGSFSFPIDDEFIQNIARTGGSETATYTLTAHLYTKADNSYNQTKDPTGTLIQLKSQTIGFTDIPLNKQLCLEIDISAGSALIASTIPYVFTLGSSETLSIPLDVYKEMNTPFFIYTRDDEGGYVTCSSKRISSLSDFTSFKSELTSGSDSLSIDLSEENLVSIESSCFDKDDNLWYIAYKEIPQPDNSPRYYNIYSRTAGTSNDTQASNHQDASLHFEIDLNDDPSAIPIAICYDNETDRICLILIIFGQDRLIYKAISVPAAEFAAYTGETDFDTLLENSSPVTLPDYVDEDCAFYIKNNILYGFSNENFFKISLDEGLILRRNTIDLDNEIYPSNIETLRNNNEIAVDDDFFINDMYVYKDKIIVFFSQKLVWRPYDQWEYYDFDYPTTYTADDFGYICRGGFLVADEETLTLQNIYGLSDIYSGSYSLEAPVYIHSEVFGSLPFVFASYAIEKDITDEPYGSSDIPAFKDGNLSIPLTETYNVGLSWSFPSLDSTALCNPEKIVAIKPKKLIIADNGTFRYSNTNNPQNSERARLVSVDLETFAITPLFECSDSYYAPHTPIGFAFTSGGTQLVDGETRWGWLTSSFVGADTCTYCYFDKQQVQEYSVPDLYAKSKLTFGCVY